MLPLIYIQCSCQVTQTIRECPYLPQTVGILNQSFHVVLVKFQHFFKILMSFLILPQHFSQLPPVHDQIHILRIVLQPHATQLLTLFQLTYILRRNGCEQENCFLVFWMLVADFFQHRKGFLIVVLVQMNYCCVVEVVRMIWLFLQAGLEECKGFVVLFPFV